MTASDIAKQLKAKRSGKGWRARCPAHKDKHPSLWFSDAVTRSNPSGILRFQCKANCTYQEIRAALGLSSAASDDQLDPTVQRKTASDIDDDPLGRIIRMRKIKQLWERCTPIVEGPIVEGPLNNSSLNNKSAAYNYLVNVRRVIPVGAPVPAVMRECLALPYYDPVEDSDDESDTDTQTTKWNHLGDFPAIVTRMDDINGKLVTLHRTYLMADGSGKLNVSKPKKLMPSPVDGCTDGAAIRLFKPIFDESENKCILGVTEGIESALAARTLFGIPTWAAWSASGLGKIDIPPQITDLVIFGDNDPPGIKAINDLTDRLKEHRSDIRIVVKLPPSPDNDWADELLNQLENS